MYNLVFLGIDTLLNIQMPFDEDGVVYVWINPSELENIIK